LRYLEHMLATIGVLSIIYHVGFDVSVVVSGSMAPTLRGTSRENGEWVLMEKVSYWFRRPRRWEIVTFVDDELGIQVMKRVVGLPGETVSLKDGRVCIGGEPVPMPESIGDLRYLAMGNVFRGKSVACGDGYYVLGDDTADSQDSRFTGPLKLSSIRGRAWLVVSPLSAARFVNP
jgi:signal peptidase I